MAAGFIRNLAGPLSRDRDMLFDPFQQFVHPTNLNYLAESLPAADMQDEPEVDPAERRFLEIRPGETSLSELVDRHS